MPTHPVNAPSSGSWGRGAARRPTRSNHFSAGCCRTPASPQRHAGQGEAGITYKDPGEAVRGWDRRQGNASLRIEAGSAMDPRTQNFVKLGLPYGEKPRLVLIHLATEAVRNGSPVIDVEDSMTA